MATSLFVGHRKPWITAGGLLMVIALLLTVAYVLFATSNLWLAVAVTLSGPLHLGIAGLTFPACLRCLG